MTRENVDEVLRGSGFEGSVDVLSIDVDGNDYWIWDAITAVTPQVVVIETHTEYRRHNVLAPYQADYDWRKAEPHELIGASPMAGVQIARRLGFRLVGGNRYGYNAFFVREDVATDLVPTVGIDMLLKHPWNDELNEWSGDPTDGGEHDEATVRSVGSNIDGTPAIPWTQSGPRH